MKTKSILGGKVEICGSASFVDAAAKHIENKISSGVAGVTEKPTAPAWKVVRTLWPDMSDRETIQTDWGNKKPEGLAASIDAITGLPDLLRQRDELLEVVTEAYKWLDRCGEKAAGNYLTQSTVARAMINRKGAL